MVAAGRGAGPQEPDQFHQHLNARMSGPVCMTCGCRDDHACLDEEGEACAWADAEKTLCTFCRDDLKRARVGVTHGQGGTVRIRRENQWIVAMFRARRGDIGVAPAEIERLIQWADEIRQGSMILELVLQGQLVPDINEFMPAFYSRQGPRAFDLEEPKTALRPGARRPIRITPGPRAFEQLMEEINRREKKPGKRKGKGR